jgi:hypothetical protein
MIICRSQYLHAFQVDTFYFQCISTYLNHTGDDRHINPLKLQQLYLFPWSYQHIRSWVSRKFIKSPSRSGLIVFMQTFRRGVMQLVCSRKKRRVSQYLQTCTTDRLLLVFLNPVFYTIPQQDEEEEAECLV